ncbi:MAG: TIGR01906 family membrane protein [Lachnospiraceae bacterium]|nr:TIGR01906 family membrane protein [Lachnospiraceae bacterium]
MILDYITDFLIGIVFTIFFISVGFIFALNSNTLYYNDVDLLELESVASLDKELIKQNYDEIVSYIKPTSDSKLKLSNFNLSNTAKTHLNEVKNIYRLIYILAIFSGLCTFIIAFMKIRQRDYSFLLISSIVSTIIPFVFLSGFATKFKDSFTKLCDGIFKNSTWQLKEKADPVVAILPERYFQHSAISIFSFALVCGLCMLILWKGLRNRAA